MPFRIKRPDDEASVVFLILLVIAVLGFLLFLIWSRHGFVGIR